MLKMLGLKMLFTAIRLIVSSDLLTQIRETVEAATSLTVSGAEKKALVVKELQDVKDAFKASFGRAGDALLNMVIEVVYTELNVQLGKLGAH